MPASRSSRDPQNPSSRKLHAKLSTEHPAPEDQLESPSAAPKLHPESLDEYLEELQANDGATVDRRSGIDKRAAKAAEQVNADEMETRRERRRGVGRRRSDWARAAEEGEMTTEQFLFIKAIDAFKRANEVMYPTWTDVLEVVRLLGYRKTLSSELSIPGAEDWTEKPQALSGVRSKPGHPERHRDVA